MCEPHDEFDEGSQDLVLGEIETAEAISAESSSCEIVLVGQGCHRKA